MISLIGKAGIRKIKSFGLVICCLTVRVCLAVRVVGSDTAQLELHSFEKGGYLQESSGRNTIFRRLQEAIKIPKLTLMVIGDAAPIF